MLVNALWMLMFAVAPSAVFADVKAMTKPSISTYMEGMHPMEVDHHLSVLPEGVENIDEDDAGTILQ